MQGIRVCLVEGQASHEMLYGIQDRGRKRRQCQCLVLRGIGPWRLDVQMPLGQAVDIDLTRGGAT